MSQPRRRTGGSAEVATSSCFVEPSPFTPRRTRRTPAQRRHTKPANPARLLQRVLFWMAEARIRSDDYIGMAKPAAEWCGELDLNPKQFERAIALLRQQRLVATEQLTIGGKRITEIRVTADA